MGFDLETAKVPQLTPLSGSFSVDDVEGELRDLFIALFKKCLGEDAFDANVAGMMHLGTFDLVRKAVNFDGLTLTDWQGSEEATRYLYRAWKSRNQQGRGLHFLRVYLQMLFPNAWDVTQLWHPNGQIYPTALSDSEAPGSYLTSRIQVFVDAQRVDGSAVSKVRKSIQSVVPARFVTDIGVTTNGGITLYAPTVFSASCLLISGGDLTEIPAIGATRIDQAVINQTTAVLDTAGSLIE